MPVRPLVGVGVPIKKVAHGIGDAILIIIGLVLVFGVAFWSWMIFGYEWKTRHHKKDPEKTLIMAILGLVFMGIGIYLIIHKYPVHEWVGRRGFSDGLGNWHHGNRHLEVWFMNHHTSDVVWGFLWILWSTGLLAAGAVRHWGKKPTYKYLNENGKVIPATYRMYDVNGQVVDVPVEASTWSYSDR